MNTITIEVEGLMNDDDRMEEFLQYRPKGGHWPDHFLFREYSIEDGHYAWASARVVEITMPLTRQEDMNRLVVPFDELLVAKPRVLRDRTGWLEMIVQINKGLHAVDSEERAACWDVRLIPVEEVAA
jgi:hypothetical protein